MTLYSEIPDFGKMETIRRNNYMPDLTILVGNILFPSQTINVGQ